MSRAIKLGIVGGLLGAILLGGSFSLSACTVSIESGEVGILTKKFAPTGGQPGVQAVELRPGLHWEGWGDKIVPFKTRQATYSYTRESNADGKENEEIGFSDLTGLPITADVNLTYRVDEGKAAELFATWRQDMAGLLDGQIRNDIRSAIAREAERVPVSCAAVQVNAEGSKTAECTSSLMAGGRQAVLQRAFTARPPQVPGQRQEPSLQEKWAAQGVIISELKWVGNLRYPESITQAIQNRTAIEQRTLAAQQREAEARANANAAIETARGEAESIRLRANALQSAPELIDQIYAQRSQGLCPPRATTCIIGQMPTQMINPSSD